MLFCTWVKPLEYIAKLLQNYLVFASLLGFSTKQTNTKQKSLSLRFQVNTKKVNSRSSCPKEEYLESLLRSITEILTRKQCIF